VTYESELTNWLEKNVKGYHRTICGDEGNLIKLQPGLSYLVNIDKRSNQRGTHWTALRVSSSNPKYVLYMDSMGYACPASITNHVNKNNKLVLCSNSKWQQMRDVNDKSCGARACISLYRMSRAKSDITCMINELSQE
jgi:hypothetical protein